MELFQKFLNKVGRTYGQADKNLFGGLLPGGADSRFISAPQNPLRPAAVVRSAPFQTVRDVLLEKSGLPKPEQFYIKGMTGGSRDITTMTPEELALVKGAYEKKYNTKPLSKVDQNSGPVVNLYGQGRNMKMAYGSLSVYPQPGGGVQIYDRWEVDKANQALPGAEKIGLGDKIDRVMDLGEGGPIPALIYNTAEALGTYEPFDIRVNVLPKEWQSTKGIVNNQPLNIMERTKDEQGFLLNQLNQLYTKAKETISPPPQMFKKNAMPFGGTLAP